MSTPTFFNQFVFGLKVFSVGLVKSTSLSQGKMMLSDIIAVILSLFVFTTAVGISAFVEQNLFAFKF